MTLPPYISYSHGVNYGKDAGYFVLLIWNDNGRCSEEIRAKTEKELKEKVMEFVNQLKKEE